MSSKQAQPKSLVESLEISRKKFSDLPIFATKTNGEYKWINYGQYGEMVDQMRGVLKKLGIVKAIGSLLLLETASNGLLRRTQLTGSVVFLYPCMRTKKRRLGHYSRFRCQSGLCIRRRNPQSDRWHGRSGSGPCLGDQY